jgi:hypothetical protein
MREFGDSFTTDNKYSILRRATRAVEQMGTKSATADCRIYGTIIRLEMHLEMLVGLADDKVTHVGIFEDLNSTAILNRAAPLLLHPPNRLLQLACGSTADHAVCIVDDPMGQPFPFGSDSFQDRRDDAVIEFGLFRRVIKRPVHGAESGAASGFKIGVFHVWRGDGLTIIGTSVAKIGRIVRS